MPDDRKHAHSVVVVRATYNHMQIGPFRSPVVMFGSTLFKDLDHLGAWKLSN